MSVSVFSFETFYLFPPQSELSMHHFQQTFLQCSSKFLIFMMSNDDEDIKPLSRGRVAGATGVQGDLVPRADRARPKYV